MKKIITAVLLASFALGATEAMAWPKHKKCTDWCTNRYGQKFRING